MGNTAVKIDEDIINAAKTAAAANRRSVTKQVEYWALLGQIGEDNPDLTITSIRGLLQSISEIEAGKATSFEFKHRRNVD